ncbi:Growth-regulating factor 3 isoform 2 [Tripterygium wilfordii]|uniref:Growth-regulating factor n=1 Tax=Tripterygium wilfordii TaxID=458696 RepID=A0A7J7CTQ3_TRIWF|nr:growth-regulating factor 3-like [Tripterygium wilfordii]KAF5737473.1 Growth-regulating factor 3 isoform 2 [Tripterygium wilfordii]
MDFHLQQWRNQQHESEEHNAAKMPKLLFDSHLQQQKNQQESSSGSDSLLPLFETQLNNKTSNLSAFPDSTTIFPRMGSYFSLAQRQELEIQALIYRYILAGAAVPPELLNTFKKSLLHSAPYFLHYPLQHYSHYQPALFQAGYWGRAAMDPEPGRCRRTDGKKWRCSRDVVTGQKYCERHVHRGRNRSRKPVEIPTPTTPAYGGADGSSTLRNTSSVARAGFGGNSFSLSGQSSSIDLSKLNHSSSESKTENKGIFEAHNEVQNKADGHILRHFFDDWPRSIQEAEVGGSNASPLSSTTCLTISMPGKSSSDVSLKLSTGNGGDEQCPVESGREPPLHLNWGWAGHQVASMGGGPLAEALRSSSTSKSSPTSVLHQLSRGSVSETSFVCS